METKAYEDIVYEKKAKIGKITLNRPEKLNTITKRMANELIDALHDLGQDNSIRVGIIAGAGEKAFSAGGDISIFPELLADITKAYDWNKTGYEIHRVIERIEKPIIAAVSGYCLAGGLEIALACDFIIAADNASFGLAEIKIGLVPAWGGMIRLPRAIPSRRAKEMIYTGEPIRAQEAEKFGLVNRVVPADQLSKCVNEIAEKLAHKSSLALRVAKTIINHGLECSDIDSGLIMERGAVGIFTAGEDSKRGVDAFLNKRTPKFD